MPVDTSMYAQPQGVDPVNRLMGYQSLANAGLQNQILQSQATQQQAQAWSTKADLISRELASVYGQDNGNPTRDHLINGVTNLMANNPSLFDKNFAAQALSDFPSEQDVASNPNAVKQYVIAKTSMFDQARAAIAPLLPSPQFMNVGPKMVGVDMNPRTNPGLVGANVALGRSPSDMASPQQIGMDAQGRPIMGTSQQYLERAQGGNPNPGGGNVAPGTVTPGAGNGGLGAGNYIAHTSSGIPIAVNARGQAIGVPPGQNGMPNAPTAPAPAQVAAPAQQQPPANSAGSGEGIPMGLPAGEVGAQTSIAGAGAEQAIALQRAADKVPQNKAMLNSLEQQITKFSTGPLAGAIGKGVKTYNQIAGAVGGPTFKEDSIAAQEEFNKQATLLAQQQFASLGGTGSNEQLSSAIHANPNDALSIEGNRRIIAMLKGGEDAVSAKNQAWQDWQKTHGAGTYGQFQTDFNKNYEPRAYWLNYMDGPQKTEMLKGMTDNERKQVMSAYYFAKDHGYFGGEQGRGGQ